MSSDETQSGARPAFPPDDSFPVQIGRYRVLGRLGSGGMGEVYKAHDPSLDRVVALKVPHFHGAPETTAVRVQRFQREARAAARVLHPNVCPVLDVGEHDGRPFIVMAYLDGPSLAERLGQGHRFEDVGEALAIMGQVLDGLAAVHAAGIIHRDLKPSNILFDAARRPVLTDFGLARPEQGSEALTSEGALLGTPHYMAPEQAAGRDVGPWTDVYGAGVVLYQMLTGRLPFEGPPLAVLGGITHDPVPPPSRWRPDLDAGLESVLLKALAKDPAARIPNAPAFEAALKGNRPRGEVPTVSVIRPQEATGELGAPSRLAASRRLPLHWKRCLLIGLCFLGGWALSAVLQTLAHLPGYLQHGYMTYSNEENILLVAQFGAVICGFVFVAEALRWKLGYTNARTLLRWAARPYARSVAEIVRGGVPVDCTDDTGETPLMKAAQANQPSVIAVLVAHGANVRRKNPFGHTALMMATEKGNKEVVNLLRQAGALE